MSQSVPRLTPDECARRGREVYEREIVWRFGELEYGRVVAVDVESGAYEVAQDVLSAAARLTQRVPDAQIWFTRIGFDTLHRIGSSGDRRRVL